MPGFHASFDQALIHGDPEKPRQGPSRKGNDGPGFLVTRNQEHSMWKGRDDDMNDWTNPGRERFVLVVIHNLPVVSPFLPYAMFSACLMVSLRGPRLEGNVGR